MMFFFLFFNDYSARWSVIKSCYYRRRGGEYEEIVVPPSHPGLLLSPCQLTEENEDFSSRQRFHQTAAVRPFYDHDAPHTNIQALR